MRAGTVAAICKTPERALSQAWACYVYDNNAVYGRIAGIHYLGAYNDEEAVALFERAQDALFCAPMPEATGELAQEREALA